MAMTGSSAGDNSSRRKRFEYHVFLSFRGPDARTFVGHVFCALRKGGFRAFLDNDGLEHGKEIQLKLYEAIHRSEMSVVILSPGYPSSRWCLDELVLIMELEALNAHHVLPIFFDVDPTVVQLQTGVYANAFEILEKGYGREKGTVEKWRSALRQIAALRGLSLNAEREELVLVENIIREVGNIVDASILYVPQFIVGRELILEEINAWLRDGSADVEFGVIYGSAGIGKSTIAKIAYNRNARTFHGYSFLANFTTKTAQPDGLNVLLEQVVFDVTGRSGYKVYNADKGINDVKAILRRVRVLLVIDDVNELLDLPDAFGDPGFFGKGSKIIITTRNDALAEDSLFMRKFKVSELEFDESKELLKVHASINNTTLSQRQEELLDGFLQHCRGSPSVLLRLGPILRHETEEKWENLLIELELYPDHNYID